MKVKVLTLLGFVLLLTACAGNQTIRGVAPKVWAELTPEQKQLIVDTHYQRTIVSDPSTVAAGDKK